MTFLTIAFFLAMAFFETYLQVSKSHFIVVPVGGKIGSGLPKISSVLNNLENSGSWTKNEVAGFVVFSQYFLIGYFRLV